MDVSLPPSLLWLLCSDWKLPVAELPSSLIFNSLFSPLHGVDKVGTLSVIMTVIWPVNDPLSSINLPFYPSACPLPPFPYLLLLHHSFYLSSMLERNTCILVLKPYLHSSIKFREIVPVCKSSDYHAFFLCGCSNFKTEFTTQFFPTIFYCCHSVFQNGGPWWVSVNC